MARVEAGEIEAAIVDVLRGASPGKGTEPGFLAAYQIFNRLPHLLQNRLRDEYGRSGRHAGAQFGPASRVAQVAGSANHVEKQYLDTGGLQFEIGLADNVEAGFDLCAIFRFVKSRDA